MLLLICYVDTYMVIRLHNSRTHLILIQIFHGTNNAGNSRAYYLESSVKFTSEYLVLSE